MALLYLVRYGAKLILTYMNGYLMRAISKTILIRITEIIA